jgi:hypothetical protein
MYAQRGLIVLRRCVTCFTGFGERTRAGRQQRYDREACLAWGNVLIERASASLEQSGKKGHAGNEKDVTLQVGT